MTDSSSSLSSPSPTTPSQSNATSNASGGASASTNNVSVSTTSTSSSQLIGGGNGKEAQEGVSLSKRTSDQALHRKISIGSHVREQPEKEKPLGGGGGEKGSGGGSNASLANPTGANATPTGGTQGEWIVLFLCLVSCSLLFYLYDSPFSHV
jgi:hypothetical protein